MSGVSAPACSQETDTVHPFLSNTYFIDIGAFFPDRVLNLSVDGSRGEDRDLILISEEVNFNESDTTLALEFGWHFGEKWRLVGQYFDSSGSDSWTLGEDVEWGDDVFLSGTNATISNNFTLVRTFIGRNFSANEKHDFGVGVGIHWLDIGAQLEGTIIVNGEEVASGKRSVHVSSPLPNAGIWYTYSISNRWAIKGRVDWLSANIDPYDGTLTNVGLGVNFQATRNFGIGLSYNDFDLDVVVDDSGWDGQVVMSYEGLYAYLSFYW
jgi:hypothetical protein